VEDAALLAENLAGFDAEDPDTRPIAKPPLFQITSSAPPLPPRFAFVRTPAWEQSEAVTRSAFAELVEALGEDASEVTLPSAFDRAVEMHGIVMAVDMAHNFHRDYEQGSDKLSPMLRKQIETGRKHSAVDYTRALGAIDTLNEMLDGVFEEYDAILTPAAAGPAPRGLASTGTPVFCSIWTYLGTPAVSLPLLQDESRMPIGVQLVARRGNDARLLRTARWLVETLAASGSRRKKARPTSPRTRKAVS
jgi:Asp-tRNA(Asn)/Glu-tRNA(Gln) amidotransferase A subunit family amidase